MKNLGAVLAASAFAGGMLDDNWPSAKGRKPSEPHVSPSEARSAHYDELAVKKAEEKRARRRARNIAILARQKS